MQDSIEALISAKKKRDHKQRNITLIIVFIGLVMILLIMTVLTKTKDENVNLKHSLDTTTQKLLVTDSLVDVLASDTSSAGALFSGITCRGLPTGQFGNGLPKYTFGIQVEDSVICSKLDKVEYFFDDASYNPRLKASSNRENGFQVLIKNSWGCMPVLPVYLHFKDAHVDTVQFPMCDNIRVTLPAIK